VRGLPGSGKTRLAEIMQKFGMIDRYWEADDFMKNSEGKYEFNPERLAYCHHQCFQETCTDLLSGLNVAVSNTFTTEKEMQQHIDLAKEIGCEYTVIIVENRHGNASVHNVPEATMQRMLHRFQVKL
jgi:uridine kinase